MDKDKEFDAICTGGIYFASVEFNFDKIELAIRSFNITATLSSEKDEEFK